MKHYDFFRRFRIFRKNGSLHPSLPDFRDTKKCTGRSRISRFWFRKLESARKG